MTWIERRLPATDGRIRDILDELSTAFPVEYGNSQRLSQRTPELVKNDSIMLAHSLIPDAMRHMFAGYAAMLAPDLPLSRRQQEMIATTVAALNRCFF